MCLELTLVKPPELNIHDPGIQTGLGIGQAMYLKEFCFWIRMFSFAHKWYKVTGLLFSRTAALYVSHSIPFAFFSCMESNKIVFVNSDAVLVFLLQAEYYAKTPFTRCVMTYYTFPMVLIKLMELCSLKFQTFFPLCPYISFGSNN